VRKAQCGFLGVQSVRGGEGFGRIGGGKKKPLSLSWG